MSLPHFFQETSALVNHLQTDFPSHLVGLTVGEYDFFNAEHSLSLEAAKKHCDLLVVGLLPDSEIQERNDYRRPLQPLEERAEMLLGTQYVDCVIDLSCQIVPLLKILKPHKYIEMNSASSHHLTLEKTPSDLLVEHINTAMDEKSATERAIAKVIEKLKISLPHSTSFHAGNSPFLAPHPAIVFPQQLSSFLQQQRSQNKFLLTTNGSFDLLHPGHLRYLKQAKAQGGTLLVLVNDDPSIQRNKGKQRPIFNQAERMQALAMLECVDYVTPFEGDTPLHCLEQIKPNLHIKGGSFEEDRIAKEKQLVESHGGRFQIFDLVAGFSSTNLLERVINRYKPEISS